MASRSVSLIVPVLALVSLVGCGGRHYWFKPGSTAQDFDRDSTSCASESSLTPQAARYGVVIEGVYRNCLRARGWVREQQLEPPPPGRYRGIE